MRTSTFPTDDLSAECEEVIRRFEEAWQGPTRPDLEHFLPSAQSGHTKLLFELVHIDLDLRLRRGEAVRVEHYLDRFPPLGHDRDALVDLIAAEYALRRNWQGGADAAECLARFPEYAPELRTRLASGAARSVNPIVAAALPVVRPDVPGYEVRGELGRGGMGVVYEAYQPALGRTVALKTLLPAFAAAGGLERFRREVEAMARLDHPHIVPVYEVGEAGGRPYFGMKLYPGGSLADRGGRPSRDPCADARLVETVARAVHHAHQRGVLHRDLKPSNVLLDEQGQPHIADFGLAKQFDPTVPASLDTAVVGTPSYIAPEQARGDRAVTTATDVYGLGTVLYEVLTGRPPFLAATPLATLEDVVGRPPRRPRILNPRVPADLEAICLACLEKDPARRYPSAAALADDLARWAKGEPITVRPVGRLAAVVRWCRRKPRAAALVALAAALLAGGLAGAWWLDRRQAVEHAEHESQRHQARGRVRGALDQQPAMRDRFLWGEAAGVASRAMQEVDAFGLEDLRPEVDQARRELALAGQLDETLLDRVTTSDEPGHGRPAAVRAYHRAFREYGLDLEAGDEADLVRRVRASASREQLVSAMFFCATYGDQSKGRLRAVARAAEPESWTALLGGIPPKLTMAELRTRLKERLTAVDVSTLTPLLLAHVGRIVGDEAGLNLLFAAQQREPAGFWINLTLGNTLGNRGRHDEAVGYLMVARGVRPHRGVAYNNLGVCLRKTGRLDDALACHKEAARLDPGKPSFLVGYGVALLEKGLPAEAIPAFEATLRHNPDHPKALCHLGLALAQTGQFAAALPHLRRGHDLGSAEEAWHQPSAGWVADGEVLADLDGRLPDVLAGRTAPRDADERLGLARVCRAKGLHAEAVGLYAEALAAGGQGPANRARSDRTDAASSAVRAGRWRQALDWLTADLADLERRVEADGKKARPELDRTLRQWRHVADLAAVRDAASLATLPEPDARAWRAFWAGVAERLER